MTFKSIVTILGEAEASGDLQRFAPAFDDDEGEKRRLYLSKELHDRLYHHPTHQKDYFANVRAVLKTYVRGDEIEDDEQFFKRLEPSDLDIWEIKILFAPSARIFGAFAGPDCFIAFTSRLREKCPFEEAMLRVQSEWGRIFNGRRRFRCWPLSNCITDCGVYS